ncbi:MAG: cytochrome b/b6 domain-containing protein [Rhodocyclaceae bacterium]|nr:cytochrome b/b6 domain-containing protein [Rhodocyclaceae bacterium]
MKAYIWDLPTRLFHWSLAVLVVAAFITAKVGGNAMVWHGRIGLAIIGLLVFRIIWGLVGSTYARFFQFVRGPATILAYLRGAWQGQGHNPLGALSVLALLGILTAQAATGLFANDDIAFEGYLVPLIGSDLSGKLTGIHQLLENGLLFLVALHVGSIVYYARVKKHNLVKPMINGWADGSPDESAAGGGALPFIVAVVIAVTFVWVASGALLPPAPPLSATPLF